MFHRAASGSFLSRRPPKGISGKKQIHCLVPVCSTALFCLHTGRRVSLFQTSSLWTVFCPTDKYKRNSSQKSSPKAHALIPNLAWNFVIFEQFFHKFPKNPTESLCGERKTLPAISEKGLFLFIVTGTKLNNPSSFARTATPFPIRRVTGTKTEQLTAV